ncbi:MAG TPA: tRNA (adenosine(37)-N6)-threonylcarbamoyltransferase complex dimerization subunit type 1 TsaB [Gemmatimonadaceae bacterium]
MSAPVLAIDAATYAGSVAVVAGERVLAERNVAMRGEREERLMPAVAEALAEAEVMVRDLEGIVCGSGPGSFTSLRIAGAIAKGLATASGAPVRAVSSLALLIAGASCAPGRYLAVLDAMRGDVYVQPAEVRPDGRVASIGAPSLVARSALAVLAAEAGATPVGPAEPLAASPRAAGIVRLVPAVAEIEPVDIASWEPEYGRLAEAQVRWERAHGMPLPGG